jgi:hypothetical protein
MTHLGFFRPAMSHRLGSYPDALQGEGFVNSVEPDQQISFYKRPDIHDGILDRARFFPGVAHRLV